MKISAKTYIYLWSIIIISEFLLLYDSHIFSMDWNMIRLPFVGLGFLLLIKNISSSGGLVQRNNPILAIELLWGGYIILFGYILTNPLMGPLTKSNTIAQVISFLITVAVAEVVRQYKLRNLFIKVSFFTISIYMLFHFITYISEINPATFIYVLSNTERTRSSLGFGHPNSLGNICLCQILLYILYRKIYNRTNVLSKLMFCMGIIMLLCSASRNAIFGLGIFAITWTLLNIRKFGFSEKAVSLIKILASVLVITFIGLSVIDSSSAAVQSISQLILESNRNWLFEAAIPAYLKSGRIWTGLGYVANYLYGTHQTPYYTLFMDNAFVYHLVATGIVGISMIIIIIMRIWKTLRTDQSDLKELVLSVFAAHMFLCLFENYLFSGIISCFVYMILYLSAEIDGERRCYIEN